MEYTLGSGIGWGGSGPQFTFDKKSRKKIALQSS